MLPIVPIIFGFGKSKRCKPNLHLDDGYDLFGIITADGDLFCGDLLENIDKSTVSSIIDDLAAANASVEKLKCLKINTLYPGHGEPLAMKLFVEKKKQMK